MAALNLQSVFRAARPSKTVRDPSVFVRRCRALACHDTRVGVRSSNVGVLVGAQQPVSRRPFSSTARRPATVVVKNPRVDEEGNEMTIDISARAAKRLRQITSAAPRRNTLAAAPLGPDSHLRVTVTSGGCHGFQYLMSLEGPSKIDEDEDTVFAAAEDGEGGGKAIVVMDEPSLELLKGSTVDFTTELIGSQFKIVGNPRATSSCGCGTSFDIASDIACGTSSDIACGTSSDIV
ncbi:hypothetical protein DV737_g1677, partial [Chaetothyriales sp. CBS 132003]